MPSDLINALTLLLTSLMTLLAVFIQRQARASAQNPQPSPVPAPVPHQPISANGNGKKIAALAGLLADEQDDKQQLVGHISVLEGKIRELEAEIRELRVKLARAGVSGEEYQ